MSHCDAQCQVVVLGRRTATTHRETDASRHFGQVSRKMPALPGRAALSPLQMRFCWRPGGRCGEQCGDNRHLQKPLYILLKTLPSLVTSHPMW